MGPVLHLPVVVARTDPLTLTTTLPLIDIQLLLVKLIPQLLMTGWAKYGTLTSLAQTLLLVTVDLPPLLCIPEHWWWPIGVDSLLLILITGWFIIPLTVVDVVVVNLLVTGQCFDSPTLPCDDMRLLNDWKAPCCSHCCIVTLLLWLVLLLFIVIVPSELQFTARPPPRLTDRQTTTPLPQTDVGPIIYPNTPVQWLTDDWLLLYYSWWLACSIHGTDLWHDDITIIIEYWPDLGQLLFPIITPLLIVIGLILLQLCYYLFYCPNMLYYPTQHCSDTDWAWWHGRGLWRGVVCCYLFIGLNLVGTCWRYWWCRLLVLWGWFNYYPSHDDGSTHIVVIPHTLFPTTWPNIEHYWFRLLCW